MINSTLMLCAEVVVRDADTQQLSLFNIIEEIKAKGFPLLLPRFTILVFLERTAQDSETFNQEILLKLGDTAVTTQNVMASFQGRLRSKSIIKIHGLAIPGPGRLTITHRADGRTTNAFSIAVSQVEQPAKA